jgi:hypothetical protein
MVRFIEKERFMRMIFRDFADSSASKASVIWARRTHALFPGA